METANIWDFNLEGRRSGTWWWWFWLFFWENPRNPDKPKQLMILWSTKDDPQIDCNGLTVDNHYVKAADGSCEFGGTIAAWHYDGQRMHDGYLLGMSPISVHERPKRLLRSDGPLSTEFAEPEDGRYTIKIGKDFEFDANVVDDDFSRLSYTKGVFFKRFDYRMTRMARLELSVREKGGDSRSKGTAYFQKVMVNAPVPPWHWGIFHFKGYTLTYYRPFIGSAILSKNPFKSDPLRLNKGLKSSIKLHDHSSGKTYLFNKISVKTAEGKDGLPAFHVSCSNKAQGSICFTVEPYAEAAWKFRKSIAGLPFSSNLHYQEYPSCIKTLRMEASDGRIISIDDTGIGIGNAEDNAGFLI